MMKIGFIFPDKDRRYKTVHLGLASLAAWARREHDDLEFHVLDTRVATRKETKEFFSRHYDLVGITVFSPVYKKEVVEIFRKLRKVDPKMPVCLGGPYVTTIREEIFELTPADFAVIGEGEITFSELISHLKGMKPLRDIDGLMYRDETGNITVNPPRKHIADLDELPIPVYDIFPMDRYPLHRMVTTRGCLFSCAWCNSSSVWNSTYRSRSPKHIMEEIRFLLENYGKKIFVFGDNSFNIEQKRVEEFCDLLISQNIRILWSASLRADLITPQLAVKLKEAGCYNASIGIESANDAVLAKIGKGTTIAKITEGIKMLKDAGIEIMSQYVIGSPGDTLETIRESVEYARDSGCDYTNFYTVLPFKGTPQWEYVEKHGRFYSRKIHEFHTISPRIVFDTPEFPYTDRLQAIRLVKKHGFHSNKDKKSWLFDFAKDVSRKIQNLLPEKTGETIYLVLKSVYKLKIVKKNNI